MGPRVECQDAEKGKDANRRSHGFSPYLRWHGSSSEPPRATATRPHSCIVGRCARRERPRRYRAAEQRDELAALHVWHGLSLAGLARAHELLYWWVTGGYAPSVQQALSTRSSGGLAAAWARSVQAGAARVPGCVSQGLRLAGAAGDEVGAFRRREGDVGRAARADLGGPGNPDATARNRRECQGN